MAAIVAATISMTALGLIWLFCRQTANWAALVAALARDLSLGFLAEDCMLKCCDYRDASLACCRVALGKRFAAGGIAVHLQKSDHVRPFATSTRGSFPHAHMHVMRREQMSLSDARPGARDRNRRPWCASPTPHPPFPPAPPSQGAKSWVKELQRRGDPSVVIALAGNKADVREGRAVPVEVRPSVCEREK